MEGIIYSYSRLDSFHNCKRGYYYTYILGERGGDNIYSYLGTVVHELTQGIIEEKETNESAIEKFKNALDDADFLGLQWMSENVKNNYIECILNFFENYNPYKTDNIKIEDYFEVDIKGVILKGYIDLWYLQNGEIHIYDFKTSSKFSKKDLEKKRKQLYLYGYALSKQYPNVKINLYYNMLKYVLQNNKLVERNKINIFEDFSEGIVPVNYDEVAEKEIELYVRETVNEIESLDTSNKNYWKMGYNPENDFFCRNLCSFRERCINNIK